MRDNSKIQRSVSYTTDVDYADNAVPKIEVIRLMDEVVGDFISCGRRAHSPGSLYDFMIRVRDAVSATCHGQARLECFSHQTLMVRGPEIIVLVEPQHADSDAVNIWDARPRDVEVTLFGNAAYCRLLDETFLKPISLPPKPKLAWHYMSDGHPSSVDLDLEFPRTPLPEFYPWIAEGPEAWINRFLASESSLCVLRGDPGTGKTSFIHYLLWRSGRKSMVTYETSMFRSDELFVEFMTSEDTDIMVMEDADVLLSPRERDGNDAMNRFLNVSAGLVRIARKKLVISTNIISDSNIDAALLRPGRCFDSPLFRNLTAPEAALAARAAGLDVVLENRDYSLAEIFSAAQGGTTRSPGSGRRMGFGVPSQNA